MENEFDFSNSVANHEIFSSKNEKVIGKFKLATAKKFWIDEFECLRSKNCSFRCNSENKNKTKGISNFYFKIIEIEFKNCLDGEKSQEKCENYILKANDPEMYLQ